MLTIGQAQHELDEVTAELGEARAAVAKAQGEARGLELRAEHGDASVDAVELVKARHVVEFGEKNIARLEAKANTARQDLSLAQHHAVADDWEERAPELRAAIREAAAKARDAAEDVRHLASAHNAEREAIRMRLNGVKDPSGRIFISPFRFKVGRETLRSIDAEAVLRAAIAKTPGDRFPIDLLADVNPNEPQRLPGSLAAERDPYPQAPRPPELTDDQIEAAVTRGHVRRSPFVQRSE